MPIELIIQLGIVAAELVAKTILVIQNDSNLTKLEQEVAIARIRGQLQATNEQVQNAKL